MCGYLIFSLARCCWSRACRRRCIQFSITGITFARQILFIILFAICQRISRWWCCGSSRRCRCIAADMTENALAWCREIMLL